MDFLLYSFGMSFVIALTLLALKNRFYFDKKEKKMKAKYGCSTILTTIPVGIVLATLMFFFNTVNWSGISGVYITIISFNGVVGACGSSMLLTVLLQYYDFHNARKLAEKNGITSEHGYVWMNIIPDADVQNYFLN